MSVRGGSAGVGLSTAPDVLATVAGRRAVDRSNVMVGPLLSF
jgi:hypothetical protein